MPQPLSRVCQNAKPSFYIDGIYARPSLAAHVMRTIATWAMIENIMGHLLAYMLGEEGRPALAMYYALTSGAARTDAFRAAARERLDAERIECFDAIMLRARPAAIRRNEFAHHVWGVTPELPDALLLADPKDKIESSLASIEYFRKIKIELPTSSDPPVGHHNKFPADRIMVYREAELINIQQLAAEAADHLNFLSISVVPLLLGASAHQLLSTRPGYDQALSELRQRRDNQTVPPQQQSE